jgi:anti-anti-sigma regulatory factor
MELRLEVRAGGIGLLRPTGRLDLQCSTELRQRLAQVVTEGAHRLVVDLG